MTYIPQNTVVIDGTDLSPAGDGTGRTYNLNNLDTVDRGMIIIAGGNILTPTIDYTQSAGTITFLADIPDLATFNISIDYFSASSASTISTSQTTYQYTSVAGFARYMGLLMQVPNKDTTTRETIGTGNGSTAVFWLDNDGIIGGTYTISYGTSYTELTDITHYTLDLANSKLTLTVAGLALVSTNIIYAEYKFFSINSGLTNAEALIALNSAEEEITNITNQIFAEYTDADPAYKKVVNEVHHGNSPSMSDWKNRGKVYDLAYSPLVKLETTVNGAYTTGGTTIELTNGTGFPNTSTIYIGGNKVTYTGRSSNTLTIPSTTPSIADEAIVRGEVIEISFSPEGSEPSYEIATPEQEYTIDYIHGRILLLSNAYWNQNVTRAEDTVYPTKYSVRFSYLNAWYEGGELPTIPIEIEQSANALAAQSMYPRIIARAYLKGNNNFRPGAFNSSRDDIRNTLMYYKPLNVGTSPYNRSHLS